MARYMMKRFWAMVATILVITTLTFVLMKVIPGSPFNEERGTNEAVQKNLEAYYHLDDPLIFQYIIYLKSIITFDFGPSIKKPSDSVNDMLERGFPVSFELGMTAIVIAVISGLVLGVIAALRRNGFLDYAAMSLAVLGISIPNFILATLLIQQFAVNLKLFPAATWTSPIHMVLPTAALAVGPMAIIARLTRSSMVEVLTQDYIRTAKAKGLSPFKIIVKHALRNALMPVITVLGTLVASILTGSFVIEKIFAIPGMGKYFVESINQRDYPVIMGTTVFYSVILIIMLFLVDLAYGLLDPRIKLHKKG
ncbi:dipeptide ABC transporter permease DppB [Bacillus spizizenii ATCC 6633 = JCM 2499]|uniref:Dipeptide transport system permease protein dppB n=1 Tax=Bacillus spizizenii (strain ATCC 23059 / NRRL B-14472 / W23) TaxID=655816 RepID=E0U1V9_BACSH|nr:MULTISPECIES: dipeptide ABC transporter permease DppB [Bacillus subtilis group]ADM37373.1 dipeptide transport system permease protein dppB [Bacillus spizizenii str. W23]AJW86748.1 peptide ABC transporter permease [Bacillus spizizenii]APH68185.1 peptide ABC transporter permease [Bacillus subtilis]EFG93975.1 dipeptide transport system permease protein dppB [Bacillus spizizenii ATCC 6633 = JCM 2499]MBE0171886.1 ABC transporter permease [Bacillus spizizenii]